MPQARKAALVTGGAIRLGKAIVLGLAKKGYNIALHYNSSQEEAIKTVDEVRKLGVQCEIFLCDLMKISEVKNFIPKVLEVFPELEVLVNSASIYQTANILETEIDLFEKNFAIHLKSPFFLTKSFAEHCGSGNVINIIDTKVHFNQYVYAAYLLSKKTLADFTKLSALELAPNFRVNAILPGFVLPPEDRSSEYIEWRKNYIPLQKLGNPEHVVQTIHFIIENDFLTGQNITVDGGESLLNVGSHIKNYKDT